MRRLLGEFRDAGGDAIEVLSSVAHAGAIHASTRRLRACSDCKASCGSDYHGPGESWMDLGDLPPLPAGVVPVWPDW